MAFTEQAVHVLFNVPNNMRSVAKDIRILR